MAVQLDGNSTPDAYEMFIDKVSFWRGEWFFIDGFESGDASAWSSQVP